MTRLVHVGCVLMGAARWGGPETLEASRRDSLKSGARKRAHGAVPSAFGGVRSETGFVNAPGDAVTALGPGRSGLGSPVTLLPAAGHLVSRRSAGHLQLGERGKPAWRLRDRHRLPSTGTEARAVRQVPGGRGIAVTLAEGAAS